MSTIKVLHVIARMNVGGTARYVEELIKNIPDSALATGYVQDSEVEDPAVESLPVFRIHHLGRKMSAVADFKAWRELSTVVREQKPAILHTHTFKAGLIGRLIRGQHLHVHTYHGHLFDDQSFSFLEKWWIRIIELTLARRTDVLISVGQQVGKDLRSYRIGTRKEWRSIAPGVKPLQKIEKSEARRRLGLSESDLIIGWMARMAPVKNPQLLLEIARKLPKLSFIMAGGGDLLDEIRKNAPANVHAIGWTSANLFWSAVDIAISTSDNEGMPVALIEAQLSGVPVIASNVGSNSEVIKHNATGLIVKKDVDSFISAIELLISSPKLLITFGQEGYQRSLQEFSVRKLIQNHDSIYQSLRPTH